MDKHEEIDKVFQTNFNITPKELEMYLKIIGNQSEFHAYCKTIADKIDEHDKRQEFLNHFAQNMQETIETCLKGELPYKRKLVSLVNFINITIFLYHGSEAPVFPKECIDALNNHYEKTKSFSIDRDGNIKNFNCPRCNSNDVVEIGEKSWVCNDCKNAWNKK
jgi:hypothetical protein